MARPLILIVEDDPRLVTFYRQALEQAGYSTASARTGRAALAAFRAHAPELVILDLVLIGELDGFDVLSALRQQCQVPVLILTGQPGDAPLLRGLDLGADSYVAKPISSAVLAARVRAQMRQSGHRRVAIHGRRFRFGDLVIDLDRSQAARNGGCVTFGEFEWRILARLLQTPGRPVTHQELMALGWHVARSIMHWDDTRPLLNCVYRLRYKLRQLGGPPDLIEAVPHMGFAIAIPDEEPAETDRQC